MTGSLGHIFWRGGYVTSVCLADWMVKPGSIDVEALVVEQYGREIARLRRELDERTRERDDMIIERDRALDEAGERGREVADLRSAIANLAALANDGR